MGLVPDPGWRMGPASGSIGGDRKEEKGGLDWKKGRWRWAVEAVAHASTTRRRTTKMAMETTMAACLALGVAFAMAWIVTKTLKSRRESLGGAHVTFAAGVVVSVLCLVLLPADAARIATSANAHLAYRVLYLLLLFLSLVVAPFHYLVREDAEDGRGVRRDRCGRTSQAVGLTLAYLLLLGVLLAVTLFAWKGGTKDGVSLIPDPGDLLRWTVVWTTVLGIAIVLAYATHGLVALPHGLVFGSKGVQGQIEELEEYLKVMQKRIDELELHAMSEDNLDVSHTERELLHLQGREQIITRKINRLRESAYLGWCQRFVMSATIALKRLLGFVLALVTLVIVVSCFASAVGTSARVTNSDITTPLDRILATNILHQEAPPAFLSFLLLYLLCAFLEGMTTFGIHIIWVKLYAVQPGHTLSEALLLLSAMMAFPIYGTVGLMLNIAPHYTRYGSQQGCEEGACKETEMFKIIVLLRETFPYMEDIFYYAGTWGFGVITILWCGGLLVGNSCRAWQDQRALVTDEEEPLL